MDKPMALVIKLILLIVLLSAEWRLFGLQDNLSKDLEPLITFLGALATYLGAEFWIAKKGSELKDHDFKKKTHNPNDMQLYKDLIALFSEGVMKFYKEHDFGGSFDRKYLAPLFEFVDCWDNAHREFVDPALEKFRMEFAESAKNLARSIVKNTTPNRHGHVSVVPDGMPPGPRPKHIIEEAKEMNDNASVFHQKYEALVRECKVALFS